MRKIYYCRNCGSTYSDEEDASPSCPQCGIPLMRTQFTADEWQRKSEDEKTIARDVLAKASVVSAANVIEEDPSWKKDIRQMRDDIHFMKTILEIWVTLIILGILAGIVLLISGWSLLH